MFSLSVPMEASSRPGVTHRSLLLFSSSQQVSLVPVSLAERWPPDIPVFEQLLDY